MNNKNLAFFIVVGITMLVFQAQAQERKVDGKIYSVNDPRFGTFNCFLEVLQISGKDMICHAYTVAGSSKIVTGHNMNGRTAAVASETHRVYFAPPNPLAAPFILRNSAIYGVGMSIDPGTRAMLTGKVGPYQVYDMGIMFIPPQRILTPVEKFNELDKRAKSGSSEASYELGECYLAGKGCEVDTNKAVQCFMDSFTSMEGNPKALKRYKELTKAQ